MKNIHVGCKLPPDLWKRVKIKAINTDTPLNVFVRRALESYLDALEQPHAAAKPGQPLLRAVGRSNAAP